MIVKKDYRIAELICQKRILKRRAMNDDFTNNFIMRYLRLLVVFVLFLSITGLLFFTFMPNYLTLDRRAVANVLVVEGWIPDQGLRKAYDEFTYGNYDFMLITGSRLQEGVTLYINSYLIFYPHDSLYRNRGLYDEEQIFEMHITSTLGKKDSAHFVFWVNDHPVTDYYTTENQGSFSVKWNGDLQDIDSVMVQYDNDKVDDGGDRNLFIQSLTLNGKSLILDYADMMLDRGRPMGKYRWNVTAHSYAEQASYYFLDRGLTTDEVIAVTNNFKRKRRTFGNAMALKQWMETNGLQPAGINVVSMDYHSRRTWLTYNRLLGQYTDVGVISSHDPGFSDSPQKKYYGIIRESLALVYYGVVILPWV